MSDACLITGGTGFLGRHVARHLKSEGHKVTLLARSAIAGETTVPGDLTDESLRLDQGYATVYHLAGLAHRVPRNDAERDEFFRVNEGGTRNLLAALERSGVLPESFVLASTVAVYGAEAGELLDETTPRNASDAYGASKREAEDRVLDWCGQHGVRCAIIRLPLVAGAGAPGNLGAMVRAMRRGRYFGIGPGLARRSMVMADDVARILPEATRVGGTFHLTDGHHPSFADLERSLASALGRKPPRHLPWPIARAGALVGDGATRIGLKSPLTTRRLLKMTSTLTFSDERARQMLGWKPSPVVEHAAELVQA